MKIHTSEEPPRPPGPGRHGRTLRACPRPAPGRALRRPQQSLSANPGKSPGSAGIPAGKSRPWSAGFQTGESAAMIPPTPCAASWPPNPPKSFSGNSPASEVLSAHAGRSADASSACSSAPGTRGRGVRAPILAFLPARGEVLLQQQFRLSLISNLGSVWAVNGKTEHYEQSF